MIIRATNETENEMIKEIKKSEQNMKDYMDKVDKEKYAIMLLKLCNNIQKIKAEKVEVEK